MSLTISQPALQTHGPSPSTSFAPTTAAITWCSQLFGRMRLHLAKHRQRHKLSDLDEHLLADIGLTADQARIEADKPFWIWS